MDARGLSTIDITERLAFHHHISKFFCQGRLRTGLLGYHLSGSESNGSEADLDFQVQQSGRRFRFGSGDLRGCDRDASAAFAPPFDALRQPCAVGPINIQTRDPRIRATVGHFQFGIGPRTSLSSTCLCRSTCGGNRLRGGMASLGSVHQRREIDDSGERCGWCRCVLGCWCSDRDRRCQLGAGRGWSRWRISAWRIAAAVQRS